MSTGRSRTLSNQFHTYHHHISYVLQRWTVGLRRLSDYEWLMWRLLISQISSTARRHTKDFPESSPKTRAPCETHRALFWVCAWRSSWFSVWMCVRWCGPPSQTRHDIFLSRLSVDVVFPSCECLFCHLMSSPSVFLWFCDVICAFTCCPCVDLNCYHVFMLK